MGSIVVAIFILIFIVLVIYGCQLILSGLPGLNPNVRNILLGLIVILLACGFAAAFGLFGGQPVIRLGG